MTLADWLKQQGRGAPAALSHDARCALLTIRRLRDGHKLRDSKLARKISDATGGAVAIEELLVGFEPERSSDSTPPPA